MEGCGGGNHTARWASNGPRADQRGYGHCVHGSAVGLPWLLEVSVRATFVSSVLLCVHGRITVVMVWQRLEKLERHRASMGPRSEKSGYRYRPRLKRKLRPAASMGPRSDN